VNAPGLNQIGTADDTPTTPRVGLRITTIRSLATGWHRADHSLSINCEGSAQ
jgi:hypothetical protein